MIVKLYLSLLFITLTAPIGARSVHNSIEIFQNKFELPDIQHELCFSKVLKKGSYYLDKVPGLMFLSSKLLHNNILDGINFKLN